MVILAVALFAVVGCQGNIEDEVLDVALVLPLTGKGAGVGEDFLQGIQLAQKELELEGVRLHVEDDQTNPTEAVTVLTRLMNTRDVDVIVTLQASVTMPLLAIADQHDVPLVASLTSLKAEEYTRKSDNAFLQYPLPETEMEVTVEYLEDAGFDRLAVFTVLDEFGNTMTELLTENYHGEVVINENYPVTELDYKTVLAKIKEEQPDAVYLIGYPGHLINFLKQRNELGVEVPVVGTMHIQSDFVRSAAEGLLEDVYAVTPTALVKGEDDFRNRFVQEHNREPDFLAPFGYDVMLVLEQVKGEKGVRAALHEVEVNGINGNFYFNEYGEIEMPLVVVKAEDREVVY